MKVNTPAGLRQTNFFFKSIVSVDVLIQNVFDETNCFSHSFSTSRRLPPPAMQRNFAIVFDVLIIDM